VASCINLDPRTYLANIGNAIFATNTPAVDSTNSADTFSITLSSSLGYFAANGGDAPTSTVTISGTKTTVNAIFSSVHFYPTKGSSASGTFSWAQSRNGTLEFTQTINFTGIANNFAEVVYIFPNSSDTFIPTRSEVYYGFADILLVAAGGHGGNQRYPGYPGGGGGGGGVMSFTNQTLTYTSYPLSAGQSTSGSGNTTGFGHTVYRGQDGKNRFTSAYGGGDSGAPTGFGGNDGSTSSGWGGGGGAGAGAVGGAPTSLGVGGNGGIGIANNITGSNVYYSWGGGGGAGQAGKLGGNGSTYPPQPSADLVGGRGGDWIAIGPATPGSPGATYGSGGGGAHAKSSADATPGLGAFGVVIVKVHA
jgi:hypothetical protein